MRLRSALHSPIALSLAILLCFSANLVARTASAASRHTSRAAVEIDQPSTQDEDTNPDENTPVGPAEEEKAEPADQCAVCDSLNDVRADLLKHKKYAYVNAGAEIENIQFSVEPSKRLMQANAFMDLVLAALTYDKIDEDIAVGIDSSFFDAYKVCTLQIRAYMQKLPKAQQLLLRDSLRRGYQSEQQLPPADTSPDQDSTQQAPAKSKK